MNKIICGMYEATQIMIQTFNISLYHYRTQKCTP